MRKVVLFLVMTLLPSVAFAQTLFRYDAKFVCGKHSNPPNNFATGFYSTSINVYANQAAQFRKRFTLSLVQEKAGGTTGWFTTTLPAGQSLQIDCDNIIGHMTSLPLPPSQTIEGFAVILSPVKLDIVAVYSAGQQGGPVSTLYMERVPIAP
jgi:hypothetical protein